MLDAKGFAAHAAHSPLEPFTFQRREPGPQDVAIAIDFCGVCHSDLHQLNNDWGSSLYPMVAGHEIVGHVTAVGNKVTRFKQGDAVGVGCMVDSCHTCASCHTGDEQFCTQGFVPTYNGTEPVIGGPTFGGYSNNIVVTESFVLKLPAQLPLAASAPLLCAGITTYSPLKRFAVGPGKKVGIVGLGGLGHVAIRLARALGADVTLFTHSAHKRADALALGAHQVVLTEERSALTALAGSLDMILDTVSAGHDLNIWLRLLKRRGALVLVGMPDRHTDHAPVKAGNLIRGERVLTGSLIGGIAETQEMLDFCGKHRITCDIELLPLSQVNTALERLAKNDVKYRFVLDVNA